MWMLINPKLVAIMKIFNFMIPKIIIGVKN